MRTSIALLAALASSVYAEDLFTYFYVSGGEGRPGRESTSPTVTIHTHRTRTYTETAETPTPTAMLLGTVLTANPSTTKVRLACPPGSTEYCFRDDTDEDIAIISGTRYEATATPRDPRKATYYRSVGCDYTAGAETQVITLVQRGGNSDTNGTVTMELSKWYYFFTATIVEGASLLSAGATATAAPSLTGSASPSPAITAMSDSTAQTSATTPTGTGSASASVSTAAAAKFSVGQGALFALAGAAWTMW
jgi:hypothetical protein